MRKIPRISLANKLSSRDIDKIAGLHKKLLWESILGEFGLLFLKELYLSISRDRESIIILAKNGNDVVGFLIATKNKYSFYSRIARNFSPILFLTALKSLILKPLLPFKFISWWFFSRKINLPKAELQFIAIDNQFQSLGLGSKMLKLLEKVYAKSHIDTFSVGTKSENKASNRFYIKKNFKLFYSGFVLGDKHNYYVSKIRNHHKSSDK
jgi:ribosomal protein S18 acetylase RimI-like enzyme